MPRCYTAAQPLGQCRGQHERAPEGQGLPCKSHEPAPLSAGDRGDSGLTGSWELSRLGRVMGTACPMLLLFLGREQKPQGCAGHSQHRSLRPEGKSGARPWKQGGPFCPPESCGCSPLAGTCPVRGARDSFPGLQGGWGRAWCGQQLAFLACSSPHFPSLR